MTLEFVFFLVTCFTFPTLSWKSWYIWPTRSVFFFFFFHFPFFCATCWSACCNSLQQLLQADFHSAPGPHFFLFHFASSRQLIQPVTSLMSSCVLGLSLNHNILGGKILSNILCGSVGKRFAWTAYIWKKLIYCTWILVYVIPDARQTWNQQ